jgi:hypothetical protein
MLCPNCSATFVLCADYADHLQRCYPRELNATVTQQVHARLTVAASRLVSELSNDSPQKPSRRPAFVVVPRHATRR